MAEFVKCDDCLKWVKKEDAHWLKENGILTWCLCPDCSQIRRTKVAMK